MHDHARPLLRSRFALILSSGLVALSLVSCGGGGGSDSPTPTPTPVPTPVPTPIPNPTPTPTPSPAAPLLRISEVAGSYYLDDVAWFEVYNPSEAPINLGEYVLRSTYVDATTGDGLSAQTANFSLPNVQVPAKGFLVVGSKNHANLKDNAQMVYVSNGNNIPFWAADGAIDLVKNGASADFVRMGANTTAPTTANAWNGTQGAPSPATSQADHGTSIVRLASTGMSDTDKPSDWVKVNFATPAGPNDVAPNVVDSDGDGIPDSAKTAGGTYAGMDLYAMGARPGVRDVFVQVDHMAGADEGLTPTKQALQKIVDTFAAKNLAPQKSIAVHFDAGPLFSGTFDPANFNLGSTNDAVAFSTCTQIGDPNNPPVAGCDNYYQRRSALLDVRRKLVFHHALFANSQDPAGGCSNSGVAQVYGGSILITLGGCSMSSATTTRANFLNNEMASTLMHELGHNLGLLHGGNEQKNFKPNYLSVMNYLYQDTGITATPNSARAAERYYLHYNLKGITSICAIENSPCNTDFILDYSNGSSIALDEAALNESSNIGRGASPGAYADWNADNLLSAGSYQLNIHSADSSYGISVLRDYNDWANLRLPFAHNGNAASYGKVTSLDNATPAAQPSYAMNDSSRNVVKEDSLFKRHDFRKLP